MSRQVFLTALLVIVAGGLGFLVGSKQTGPGLAHAQKKEATGWEFGRLVCLTDSPWKWEDASGTKEGKDFSSEDLAKKLKFKTKPENVAQFLNELADQGWELVTHAVSGANSYYTFRRKK